MEKLYIMYGNQAEKLVISLMEAMEVKKELAALGDPVIAIKPNLVVAQPAEWGATTSPQLVAGVVSYLQNAGFQNITIMESSWVGDDTKKAFNVCGYEKISQQYNVPLLDLKEDSYQGVKVEGESISVCQKALEADYLINMPVLKAHCQTKLTCALKNLKGCIPDGEKRRFHTMGLHKPIAYLNKALKAHLTIVDGIIGDLTHEEGGNPVAMNRVLASRDPVLVDGYAANLLGYQVAEIPYILLAEELGLGQSKACPEQIVELNSSQDAPGVDLLLGGEELDYLKQFVVENQACSACYGNLMHALMRLKEQGLLKRIKMPLCVGQGYKGKAGVGTGIGNCTKGFTSHIAGCPPKADQILKYLLRKSI